MSTKQEKLSKFLQWANSHGSYVSEQIVFKVNESNGQIHGEATETLTATPSSKINSTTPLISVPETITINPNIAEQYFGSQVCGTGNRNQITQLLLAKIRFDTTSKEGTILKIKNVGEVNANDFFKPYVDLLPSGKEIGSPLFWDGNERALLKGTDAYLTIDKRLLIVLEEWYSAVTKLTPDQTKGVDIKADLSFYEVFKNGKTEQFATYLNQVDGSVSWCSFPAYLWTYAIFTSRAFPYVLQHEAPHPDGIDKVHDLNEGVLLPVFDLLNHDNDAKAKWGYNGKDYLFNTEVEVAAGNEIFHSYGLKSNEILLFNYGFVLAENKEDYLTLALRIPPEQVPGAQEFGVTGFIGNDIVFNFRGEDGVDDMLVRLFTFLVKYESEKGVTLKNSLEGLKQLALVIQGKIDTIKNVRVPDGVSIDKNVIAVTKIYRTLQRKHLQKTMEEILKIEKRLIKKHKPDSFKTFFKNDQVFANALLLTFGIDSYEKLISSEDDLTHVLILWIMRVSNKKQYNEKSILPDWICHRFQQVAQTTKISESDVKENLPTYRALFPKLSDKIPEVFKKGDWSIKNFIIAEQLKSEIVFIRETSNEAYFIDNVNI